ncbi:Glycosyl transferase family 2 [Roseimaritima ulvae]|uniref:Glycosyl transferase family 2 n=1 Tax=Roseimaritima ulvae TaxID=980254 RepID=A0A5B9R7P1_9BACT|nr:Glycosyl transferase family 2 [Roseimaritima ulvae]
MQEQSQPPDEIIVVDDASPDDTYQIASDLAASSCVPTRVLRLEKNSGGPCKPINHGIGAARGDLIFILEQDDLMPSSRIADQLAVLRRYPDSALVIGRFELIDGHQIEDVPKVYAQPQFLTLGDTVPSDAVLPIQVPSPQAFAGLLQHNFTISNSNFCFPKSTWRQLGGFDEAIATVADLDFALRAVVLGPLGISPTLTLRYRFNESSLNRRDLGLLRYEGLKVRMNAIRQKPAWGNEYFWTRWTPMRQQLIQALKHLRLKDSLRLLRFMFDTGSIKTRRVVRHS